MPRMPEQGPGDLPDVGEFRDWRPEAQELALGLLQQREEQPWKPFYCRKPKCNGQPHVRPADKRPCPHAYGHEWHLKDTWVCRWCGVGGTPVDEWLWPHARDDQHPPKWFSDWFTWLLSGGRGSGKTRTGSEVTHRATNIYGVLRFVAPTGTDFRDTMVEDPFSGILVTSPPGKRPEWEPSKKRLTWPNGCVGFGFSAEEPDRLRGKQSGFAWLDEPAHYVDAQAVWDNLLFGHRIPGKKDAQPKVVCTSTPKPIKWLKDLIANPQTITYRVSSHANASNLAESYKRNVLAKHEGTRLGRQEIEGELLEDVEGALWTWDMFVHETEVPALKRILVGIDPAGTANKRSDETGIIVVGSGFDDRVYVVDDGSGRYSPAGWADKSAAKYEFWKADALVPEVTYGRDMVTHTLENSRLAKSIMPRILPVDSRRGKQIRAEPVVALYEKKRVVHVGERGSLSKLEDELTSWVPGESPSPNRLDALVHAITKLMGGGSGSIEIAAPSSVRSIPGSPTDHAPTTTLARPRNPWGIYLPGGTL